MYNARELITESFYLAGIVARDLESVSGSQITNGLRWLNEILSGRTLAPEFVPYYQQFDLNAVVGQEKYFIPKLILAETITFSLSNVRYKMYEVPRKGYFGTSRTEGIKTLPYSWHLEKVKGGADVYLYFLPESAYAVEIWGKFGLDDDVKLDDDLDAVYEKYYLDYLKYFLATRICSNYKMPVHPVTREEFKVIEDKLEDNSPKDMSVRSYSSVPRTEGLTYADANLGRGWRPI